MACFTHLQGVVKVIGHRRIFGRLAGACGEFVRSFWLSSLRRCWLLYLAASLLLGAGLGWGIRDATQLDQREAARLEEYIAPVITPKESKENQALFQRAALRNLVPLCAMYVAGLTVIGMPVVAGILFLRGYALGFTGSFLVHRKGLHGLGLLLATIIPQNLILVALFTLGAVASFSFALLLWERWFNPEVSVFPWLWRYTLLMVSLGAGAIGAGLVEVYVVPAVAQAVFSLWGRV